MKKQYEPHLAKRAYINEGDDIILAINAEAKEMKRMGKPVINASIGTLYDEEGHFSTLPMIDEALKEALSPSGRSYPQVGGSKEFQECVLQWLLQEYHSSITSTFHSKVVATAGGTGAIALAFRNYTELDQSILIPTPGWANYKAIASQVGAIPLPYSLYDGNHFNQEGVSALLMKVAKEEGRVFFVLNDPSQNPTGYTLSEVELDGFIASLNKASDIAPVTVLFDIAYFDFTKSDRSRLIFKKLSAFHPNVLSLFAFSASKTFSIYGLRLGALIAFSRNKEEIQLFGEASLSVARAIWSCANAHAIEALVHLLKSPTNREVLAEELTNERLMLEKRGELFTEEARAIGLKTYPYISGFFVTMSCSHANEIAKKLKAQGIFVLPMKNEFLRVALSCITLKETKGLAKKIYEAMK
ncbi:MAG: pyridoxal phosphate-dependent aminotransferase [Bacilli bacterium]|nr:pyridoxal phosphate-dependent aminotransferase [Bacilli bacterium]